MSTKLNSWGSWLDAYNPMTESEGYTAYKESLPKGVFPVDESDWRQSAFQKNLENKYSEYQNTGGNVPFEKWSEGTTTAPYRLDGVNEQTINRNITNANVEAANFASSSQGGNSLSPLAYGEKVQSGEIVIPGYNTEIGTPEHSSNLANADKGFSTVENGIVPVIKSETVPVIEDNPEDTGTNQKDEYDILTGAAKDGNGTDITPTKEEREEAKGIFDKASTLFGDTFNAADLKRMTLYTLGGLMTGGSAGGSFKWAATRVLQEKDVRDKNKATVNAAKIKASKDHGKRTGNNSFGINVEGIDGLTHIRSYEIGSAIGDISVVDVPDPKNPDKTIRMTVDNFHKWVKDNGGESAKGSNEKNMPKAKADRVFSISKDIADDVSKVFSATEGMTSFSGQNSVASYFSSRGYDLDNPDELVNVRWIASLASEDAAASFRGDGKQIKDMSPYFDKYLLSTEVKVPGDGVWGMMTDPFLADPTPIDGVTMDPKKIAVLVSTMKGMAGKSGFEGVKENFKELHKEYMTLKAAKKVPAMELNPGENEFYTWVTKELKKPL